MSVCVAWKPAVKHLGMAVDDDDEDDDDDGDDNDDGEWRRSGYGAQWLGPGRT